LFDRLEPDVRKLVEYSTGYARERGVSLYAVGGTVRDLLLTAPHVDVDLLVVGDAIELAHGVGTGTGAKVTAHPRFGTATVKLGPARLDFTTARSERYARPGALPVVSPGLLEDDLARRDFSINALALGLTGEHDNRIVDQHGGLTDLRDGLVRVLHERSFQDDPTRMFRAVRYAARLSFEIEPHTLALLRRDLACLGAISGTRLRHELERIAEEERPKRALSFVGELGLLEAVDSRLCVSARQLEAIERLPDHAAGAHRTAIIFTLLLGFGALEQTEALISRLSLTGRQAGAVRGLTHLLRIEGRLSGTRMRPSEVAVLLDGAPVEALEAFALLVDDDHVRERVRSYLDHGRHVRSRLRGDDVEALGVEHGPEVGAALGALRAARLDGEVTTREDEVMFVERLLGRKKVHPRA
jgi:tRNA nucleotidyltransferase (CCA-adding enzyme)